MKDPSAILTTYFRSQTSNFHKRATLFLSRGTGLLSGKSLYSVLDIIVWNYFSNHNEIANSKHLLYVTNRRMFHGVTVLHKSYNILLSTVSVINNKKQLGTVFMHNRKRNQCTHAPPSHWSGVRYCCPIVGINVFIIIYNDLT